MNLYRCVWGHKAMNIVAKTPQGAQECSLGHFRHKPGCEGAELHQIRVELIQENYDRYEEQQHQKGLNRR